MNTRSRGLLRRIRIACGEKIKQRDALTVGGWGSNPRNHTTSHLTRYKTGGEDKVLHSYCRPIDDYSRLCSHLQTQTQSETETDTEMEGTYGSSARYSARMRVWMMRR